MSVEARPSTEHQPTVSTFHFKGRSGKMYHTDFHHYEGPPRDETRNNFAHPRFTDVIPQLAPMIRRTWPLVTDAQGNHVSGYQESTVTSTVAKFDKFADFALTYDEAGMLVAFNVYKVGKTEIKAQNIQVIYVEHAGTLPEFQGDGITAAMRNEFFKRKNPDIVCGSSANGIIYKANEKIAKDQGFAFYPTAEETPAPISKLGHQIVDELGITSAPLDDRLVRTYSGPVAASQIPHPLAESLQLTSAQHVFYMLLNPNLNRRLLEE
ncbi:MAG: hypothetical protein ACM3IJ_05080 [Candidatus Levyibacteriota bacterium]